MSEIAAKFDMPTTLPTTHRERQSILEREPGELAEMGNVAGTEKCRDITLRFKRH